MTYVKDARSGLVINTSDDYEKYQQAKEQLKKVKATETKVQQTIHSVDSLKEQVNNMERMLKKLIQHFDLE
jgi:hypothetical protein